MTRYRPPLQITPVMVRRVAEICERLGRWSVATAATLSPQLRRTQRLRTIHASLAIENQPVNLAGGSSKSSPKGSPKTEDRLMELLKQESTLTVASLGERIGISKRAVLKHLAKLKSQNRLRRLGPARGGHWEIG